MSTIESAAERLAGARRGPARDSIRPPAAPDFTATVARRLAPPAAPVLTGIRKPVLLTAIAAEPSAAACEHACGAGGDPAARADTALLVRVALMAAALGAGIMYSATSLVGTGAAPTTPASAPTAPAPRAANAGTGTSNASAVPVPAVAARVALDRHAEARAFVFAWAQAWSSGDAEAYLGHYAADFAPGAGLTRQHWEAQRRKRLASARELAVTVRDLALEDVAGGRLRARFTQDYRAAGYREMGSAKQLLLEREAAGWRIVAERAG